MPREGRVLRSATRQHTNTAVLDELSDVDVGGGIEDDGIHELLSSGSSVTMTLKRALSVSPCKLPKRSLDGEYDESEPVMKMRRITTPAYALRRIDRHVWPSEVVQKKFKYVKPSMYTVRKQQELAPNPNNPHFCFIGHHRLYPYRFYLDLIRRAKRDPSIISVDMPKLRPAGGTIVVYDCHGIDQNRALHNDGYRWGRSKGVKLIQSVGNRLVRTYHFLYDPRNPAGDPKFKKYRFSLKGESYGIMVMHYIGDEKHAVEVSGRCMRNNDPMAMLAYSEAQQGVEDFQSLHLLPLPDLGLQSNDEEKMKFREILLTNIHTVQGQLLYESDEAFVERIEVDETGISAIYMFCYPLMEQLVAVAGFLQQCSPLRTVQLLYHTEPITMDYHLSTLAFIHPFFEGDQVMPLAFMISSTSSPDYCDDHDGFLSTLYERYNDVLHGRFVIITSQGVSFTADAFPLAEHIRCWDDFKRVKISYIETHFGGAYLSEYASDMNILMSCTFEKLFDEMWTKISACKRYVERPELYSYFHNVWSDFKFTGSIWHLKKLGIADADKGVVWRPCKGLSKLVLQLCEANAFLDTVILSLFLLSNAFRRLFIAGFHQSGAWRLKKCYRERFQQSHLKLPKLPYAPAIENIVLTAFNLCANRPFKRSTSETVNESSSYVDNDCQNHINSGAGHIDLPSTRSLKLLCIFIEIITVLLLKFPVGFQWVFFSNYVRLISPMTFVVRLKDDSPCVVEAVHRDETDCLQWYCSCGLMHRCTHITNVMFVFQCFTSDLQNLYDISFC
ncbi:unnamed protein product [Thelazia callipaeda]|uniref:SWIM-type domain-containing protein n=1 Tax=Thelazia callipaeda TaxID=103827 RepID=A0A0N5CJF2_THECL|nr:unnamed protein product [Thelazia callipaeda]